MADLPTGTVTFLFTDIEGSTTRWEHHPEAMRTALVRHDALLRQVITAHGGFVFKMMGDAVYAAFAVAADAVAAALAAQRAVMAEEWGEVAPLRVRMALHSGAAQSRESDYFGPTLNRVARILATGYGGQILLSLATEELARDTLPAGVSLKDLGEHALKDLLRPEHVYQLACPDLPAEFPPLKSLEHHPHNLPVQPTPLIGREQEVATVCGLLRRPEVHLVTLTGPAGVGKTRLGLQVGAELADRFADGVFFVPLAPVSDPEQVVPAIAQTLAIGQASDQPLLSFLQSALKDKHLLLLLDNFEQVVQAALHVAELLAACSQLKVLVTSRVVLHVRAEREFVVPPLSLPNLKRLPDLVTLSQYEAVALFIERAQAVKLDFQVTNANAPAVAGICARLDGLPLAIELAAARVKYFPPQTLLTRLERGLGDLAGGARDLPARQQTLHGAIAWSYDLLSPQEQQLFRRLAVFVDGCTLVAAEEVCTATGELKGDILEGLASLVDKSLLRQEEQAEGEARFWMLQVLREFGLEALANMGETEATRQAHARCYLALAEEAEPHLRGGGEQLEWLTLLKQEQENLRAALRWFVEHEETERALRLSGATWWYWFMRGYFDEVLRWLEAALVLPDSGMRTASRAQVLAAAGFLNAVLGNQDVTRARKLLEESMALYQELGDRRGYAHALQFLGDVYNFQGDFATARTLMEQGLALCRELGDDWKVAYGLNSLGMLMSAKGETAAARVLWEECLTLGRKIGEIWGLARTRSLLAEMLLVQGDYPQAVALAQEGLKIAREYGDRAILPDLLAVQAEVLKDQDDVQAAQLVQEGLAVGRDMGGQGTISLFLRLMGDIALNQGNIKQANEHYRESLSLALKLAWMKGTVGRCLLGLARVARTEGRIQSAARLFGAAEPWLNVNRDMAPVDRATYDSAVAEVRAHLGKEAFAAIWTEGQTMPLEQVIEDVLRTAG